MPARCRSKDSDWLIIDECYCYTVQYFCLSLNATERLNDYGGVDRNGDDADFSSSLGVAIVFGGNVANVYRD